MAQAARTPADGDRDKLAVQQHAAADAAFYSEVITNATLDLSKPRYDMSTYIGRLRHFLDIVDPRTLLVREHQLAADRNLLQRFKNGQLVVVSGAIPGDVAKRAAKSDDQAILASGIVPLTRLYEAKKHVDAIIHPDTGEKIPICFRMSGYVPFGAPIVAGMLMPNLTLRGTAFWQWLNQSHNACVNYCNRNASRPTPDSMFVAGYAGAVSSAVGIALTLQFFLKKAQRFPEATRVLAQRFVPYPAVAFANVCNVFLMRRGELENGVEVFEQDSMVPVGVSKIAARNAVSDTMLTRVLLPAPILLIPPAIMAYLDRNLLKRMPKLTLPVNFVLGTVCFGLSLPACLALFRQYAEIPTSELEPEIAAKTTSKFLVYNKGL